VGPPLDLDALAEFLGRQRWFSGKGRPWRLSALTSLGWLREDAPGVELLVVEVEYGDGERDAYQLPVVRYDHPVDHLAHVLVARGEAGGREVYAYDALHDRSATRPWLAGIAAAGSGAATSSDMVFHRSPGDRGVPLDSQSLVLGAEQSNTSLVFGGEVILKVYRRLAAGLNPDIEIHEALAAAGSTHIATPLGWVEGTWTCRPGEACTGSLAMAQVFLRDATEGWESALASVRDLLAEEDLHPDEVGGDFAAESERLGQATAEVHLMLAQELGSRAATRDELAATAEAMRERLRRAAAEVPQLEPFVPALAGAYDALAEYGGELRFQRIHGDFHLGQVMRTLDGWKLLDFEGEPAKSLTERRAPDSPLKDVAGMLRSFDYASRHLLADRHDPQLEYRAAEWAQRNRDAFCAGYGSMAGRNPCEDSVALRAFETDKAVYEVVYEARNRPTWLRIPLSAIERLAAAS
jgi:maltokinase